MCEMIINITNLISVLCKKNLSRHDLGQWCRHQEVQEFKFFYLFLFFMNRYETTLLGGIWFISGLQVTNLHQKSNNKMGRLSWYYTYMHTFTHLCTSSWSGGRSLTAQTRRHAHSPSVPPRLSAQIS